MLNKSTLVTLDLHYQIHWLIDRKTPSKDFLPCFQLTNTNDMDVLKALKRPTDLCYQSLGRFVHFMPDYPLLLLVIYDNVQTSCKPLKPLIWSRSQLNTFGPNGIVGVNPPGLCVQTGPSQQCPRAFFLCHIRGQKVMAVGLCSPLGSWDGPTQRTLIFTRDKGKQLSRFLLQAWAMSIDRRKQLELSCSWGEVCHRPTGPPPWNRQYGLEN